MFEPSIVVRIAVVFYVILAGFASISLWRNAAAPDALQHSGIILAGLLPALIAVLPYLRVNELENKFDLVIIFDEQAKHVIPLGSLDTYTVAYQNMYANLDQDELTSREIEDKEVPEGHAKQYWTFFHDEKGWDLIERLVLMAYANKFLSSWDIEFTNRRTPYGNSIEGKHGGSESTEVNINQIRSMFQHNHLIKDRWMDFVPPYFRIPKDAELKVKSDKHHRTITIANREAELLIDITPSGSGLLAGLWGKYLPKETEWANLNYRVRITLKYKKYSPMGPKYERWFNNVSTAIEQYDWDYLDQYREKELMRSHLEGSH